MRELLDGAPFQQDLVCRDLSLRNDKTTGTPALRNRCG